MDGVALFRARCVADYKCFCYCKKPYHKCNVYVQGPSTAHLGTPLFMHADGLDVSYVRVIQIPKLLS